MLATQCQVARAILKWSIADLAKRAKLTEEAIAGIEDGSVLDVDLIGKAQSAFEDAGVEFTYGEKPGVRVRTLDGIIEVSAGNASKPTKH